MKKCQSKQNGCYISPLDLAQGPPTRLKSSKMSSDDEETSLQQIVMKGLQLTK